MSQRLNALITTRLDHELIPELRSRHPGVELVYPEDLLPSAAYPGEHRFPDADSSGSAERWKTLLAQADIMFDFGPRRFHSDLWSLPHLKWIQASSAGIGQFARRVGLTSKGKVMVTTARGVHGAALAEFAVMALIYFNRDFPGIQEDQRQHAWHRRCGRLIAGQTVGIVGMGSVGREVAAALGSLGAKVTGVVRGTTGRTAVEFGVAQLLSVADLDSVLPSLDVVVLAVPHTDETEGLLSASRLARLREGAVLVNLARGSVVDEEALAAALRAGRLGGAALDVAQVEPLPAESPLWDLPNVLITPHSMSTVKGENHMLMELFSANLSLFADGRPLRNVLDPERLY
ncbi:MAG: D-2-hydroxyacid dehydrogenase [Candidatus Dormibacteria bacterium]